MVEIGVLVIFVSCGQDLCNKCTFNKASVQPPKLAILRVSR
jgi:hypothetical protein